MMNTLERKKVNLLIHLARIDGKFDKTERALLQSFLREKGLVEHNLTGGEDTLTAGELTDQHGRIELLYWALKLAKADGYFDQKEVAFCRDLAIKLNFKTEIVDYYSTNPLPDLLVFEQEIDRAV